MSIRSIAEETAEKILSADANQADITNIVEAALVEAIKSTKAHCVDAVNICCSSDQDIAHKISEEMHRKEEGIISNLMSLR